VEHIVELEERLKEVRRGPYRRKGMERLRVDRIDEKHHGRRRKENELSCDSVALRKKRKIAENI